MLPLLMFSNRLAMKSNYKRLGDYIRLVDVRNRDLSVTELRGLSMTKQFRESTSNIIGVDLSKYKIVYPGVFAFDTMSVIRVHKVPIVLNNIGYPVIISPAYITFEISRKSELDEDFLFLFFKTTEFDRYADFKSDASVRGGYNWEELCDTQVPVPPIVEQRKIVAEYQAVERRIENNRRLIATLESAAQTIYRQMFVDNIDSENLPQGWRIGKMKDVATFAYGKMPKDKDNGVIPVFSGYGVVGYCNEAMYDKQHIVVIARGDSGSGKIVKSPKEFYLTNLAIAIKLNNESYRDYLYYHLLSLDTSTLRTGSAQAQVTINSIEEFDILIPTVDICAGFYSVVDRIGAVKLELAQEEDILNNFSSLLLTKLSKL